MEINKLSLKLILCKLTILFIFCLNSCNYSGNHPSVPLDDFAFKDTANIKKVKISDTENNEITISRNRDDKKWRINNSDYLANSFNINLILETFYTARVKRDVEKNGIKETLKRLSVRHKKIEIFTDNLSEPIKTWYIGTSNKDHVGNYMLLQNKKQKSSVPYVVYKPGFNGILDVRFFTNWKDWRSHEVFNYPNSRFISSINTIFNENPLESYSIKNNNKDVDIYNNKNESLDGYNLIQVKHYLTHFHNINYNEIVFKDSSYIDSVFNSIPHIEFKLEDINNKNTHVRLWKIKNELSETGWDKEYAYIKINEEYELLKVQYFSWDILCKPLSYFQKQIESSNVNN